MTSGGTWSEVRQKGVVVTGSQGLLGSEVSSYLTAMGSKVHELDLALGHDLTDERFVRNWFSEHPAAGLVNMFALNEHVDGTFKGDSYLDVSLESFERFLKVNVSALFSVCREFIRANHAGSVVNASSIYAEVSPRPSLYGGAHKHPGYGSSKGAVLALSRYLAIHAAPDFRVNCLLIGGVSKDQNDSFRDKYSETAPLGRLANPSEIPPLVHFLLSEASSYITGSVMAVDGGWTA